MLDRVAEGDGAPGGGAVVAVPDGGTAVVVKQLQPPDTPATASLRRWVFSSFWVVVIILGLPAWWNTTAIYQAGLPLATMLEWSSGAHFPHELPVNISVRIGNLDRSATGLISKTQQLLDRAFDSTFLAPRLVERTGDVKPDDLTLVLSVDESAVRPRAKVEKNENVLTVSFPPSAFKRTPSVLAGFIQAEIGKMFASEVAMLKSIVQSDKAPRGDASHNQAVSRLAGLTEADTDMIATRNRIAFARVPAYHLTFSLLTPVGVPSSWDIRPAVEKYIDPLIDALSGSITFTTDTQVQLYSRLASTIQPPRQDVDTGVWLLDRVGLNGFVNLAEWALSPKIGSAPTINFAIYVAGPDNQPLSINGTDETGWVVPQWGSVQLVNPSVPGSSYLAEPELERAMLAIAHDLLTLVGVPGSPSADLTARLSTFQRLVAVELIASSSSTLGAIVRLLGTLPSMAIPNTVASSVADAIAALERATGAVRAGEYQSALALALQAHVETEKAFFDPSMVAQMYFPDEHKMAVYLPLLGPVSTPLVLASLSELVSVVKGWRG